MTDIQVENLIRTGMLAIDGNSSPMHAQDIYRQILKFRYNPDLYMQKILNIKFITPQIQEVVRHVAHHKLTFVRAGHGIGKSHNCAALVPWFLETHPHSLVYTTAPTARQVSEIIWKEVYRHRKSAIYPVSGKLLANRLRISHDWQALGFASNQAVAYQGLHAKYMLWIIDEADGVMRSIWQAILATSTGTHNKIIAIGNPIDRSSMFKELQDKYPQHTFEIPSYESPNIIQNEAGEYISDEIIPGCATLEWVENMIGDYGIDSPVVQGRVMARYPKTLDTGILSEDDILSCAEVEKKEADWVIIAVDPSYGGSDDSMVSALSGNTFHKKVWRFSKLEEKWNTAHPNDRKFEGELLKEKIVEIVNYFEYVENKKVTCIIYDAGGVSTAVHEWLHREYDSKLMREGSIDSHMVNLVDVLFGSKVTEHRSEYKLNNMHMALNKRAEMFLDFRRHVVKQKLHIPIGYNLHKEMPLIKYFIRATDQKIQIESKEDIKKRMQINDQQSMGGGFSPDLSDSMVLAVHAYVLGLHIVQGGGEIIYT